MGKPRKTKDRIEVRDKRTKFSMIENTLLDYYGPALGAFGIATYCILARFADSHGEGSYPSYQTIADMMGAHRRTAIRSIATLVELGLIGKEERKIKGESTSNVYTLLNINIPQGSQVVGSDSQSPPSDSQSPPSDSQSPPSDSQSPDQYPINNTQLTIPNEDDDDDAWSSLVKVNGVVGNSQCRDHAHDATRTDELSLLRDHVVECVVLATGATWDDRDNWIKKRNLDELRATLLWCLVYTERVAQKPDSIDRPVGFIRDGVEKQKDPGLRPQQIQAVDDTIALIMGIAETGVKAA